MAFYSSIEQTWSNIGYIKEKSPIKAFGVARVMLVDIMKMNFTIRRRRTETHRQTQVPIQHIDTTIRIAIRRPLVLEHKIDQKNTFKINQTKSNRTLSSHFLLDIDCKNRNSTFPLDIHCTICT